LNLKARLIAPAGFIFPGGQSNDEWDLNTGNYHIAPLALSRRWGFISLSGKVVVTSKSDKEVAGISFKLSETRQTGSGGDKTIKEFTFGETAIDRAFPLKTGETKETPFSLPYSYTSSLNDRLKQNGLAVGKALGGLGKMFQQEKSTFFVMVQTALKGNVFPPTDSLELKAKE
jgi:hypothetical protein